MGKSKSVSLELAKATAMAIMESFVPKDENAEQFSFNFTIPPSSNFKASFAKQNKLWVLVGCEAVIGE